MAKRRFGGMRDGGKGLAGNMGPTDILGGFTSDKYYLVLK